MPAVVLLWLVDAHGITIAVRGARAGTSLPLHPGESVQLGMNKARNPSPKTALAAAESTLVSKVGGEQLSPFDLPPYRVGPYRLRVLPADKSCFADKRRRVECDWNAGVVHLSQDSAPKAALRLFLRHLVTAIHYRSGLNDRSNEESFTHSLASGLVELSNQPAFFGTLLRLLEQELNPGAGWHRAYRRGATAAPAPKRFLCRGRVCKVKFRPESYFKRDDAYGFYLLKRAELELCDTLSGQHLALIALHEALHFMHETAGLKDSTKEMPFRRTQVDLLLDSLKTNPGWWRWWCGLARPARR